MDDNYRQTLGLLNKALRKDNKSLKNRIQSILLDNTFLEKEVIPVFPRFPIIPNERCGVWYCNPETFKQTSYFKSTDGHTNQWDFSLRRLNLHLLPTISHNGGLIIVDSTRRGKRMPDALSKTVPLWCAVLNSLMLEHLGRRNEQVLFCPPNTVSRQECAQMEAKIPQLVEKFRALKVISGAELARALGNKILRPLWVYPGSSLLHSQRDVFTGELSSSTWEAPEAAGFIPLVLCTVSYQCQDGVDNRNGFIYVQGAADDHELWSKGLTASLLWRSVEVFRDPQLSDEVLEGCVVSQLNADKTLMHSHHDLTKLVVTDALTNNLHLGKISANIELTKAFQEQLLASYSLVVILSETVELAQPTGTEEPSPNIRVIQLSSGSKKSSKALRVQLITLCPLIESYLREALPVLVCCNDGKDMSVCVLLSVLCRNYDAEDWKLGQPISIHKTIIRKHLSRMIAKVDGRNINPARASLNSVNSYLMQ
ncbi:LADA_0H05094g1_1 [Lachancea dasiensis]|uniref:LADA_0H05094g1_1 n=1 Tax=Lachancea dasiensis TaxID=1072105 RepID=A0A1G4K108_9SACH|nr:LADA_0H05094g1_1 [Lachancea dasiensis]